MHPRRFAQIGVRRPHLLPQRARLVGGIRETVVPGETGLLVPVDDACALAEGILRLFDDREDARRLSAEARRRVVECFSEKAIVASTLALCRR